jgi:hypothetical protein
LPTFRSGGLDKVDVGSRIGIPNDGAAAVHVRMSHESKRDTLTKQWLQRQ